jgi:hypothetical protein
LNPLEEEHVRELIDDSEFPSTIKYENNDIRNYFISKAHISSGGIPRLIEFLWLCFKRFEEFTYTKESIDILFEKSFELILSNARDSDKFCIDSDDLKRSAFYFYALSLYSYTFKSDEIISFSTPKDEKFLDLIPRLPFYIKKKEDGDIQIVRTFMYRFLEQSYRTENQRILFKLTENLESILLQKDFIFELFITSRFMSILEIQKGKKISSSESLSFLHGSFVSDLTITFEINNIISLPKVTLKGSVFQVTEMKEIDSTCTIQPQSIEALLKVIFETKKNLLGIPREKSSSPDLVFFIENKLIEFQMKSGKEEIGLSKLEKEIKKSYSPSKSFSSVFVLFAMNLSKELKNLISKNSFIRFTEGLYYSSSSGISFYHFLNGEYMGQFDSNGHKYKENLSEVDLSKLLKLTVPKNLEVVVLGEEMLIDFVGEENHKIMKELNNEDKEDKTKELLIKTLSLINPKKKSHELGGVENVSSKRKRIFGEQGNI